MTLHSASSDPSNRVSFAKPKKNNVVDQIIAEIIPDLNLFLPFDNFKIDLSTITALNSVSALLSSYKRML